MRARFKNSTLHHSIRCSIVKHQILSRFLHSTQSHLIPLDTAGSAVDQSSKISLLIWRVSCGTSSRISDDFWETCGGHFLVKPFGDRLNERGWWCGPGGRSPDYLLKWRWNPRTLSTTRKRYFSIFQTPLHWRHRKREHASGNDLRWGQSLIIIIGVHWCYHVTGDLVWAHKECEDMFRGVADVVVSSSAVNRTISNGLVFTL